jgi:hypothetical protein
MEGCASFQERSATTDQQIDIPTTSRREIYRIRTQPDEHFAHGSFEWTSKHIPDTSEIEPLAEQSVRELVQ